MAESRTFYARGDSASAKNAYVNSVDTKKIPVTEFKFTSGTDGDLRLDYNDGGVDPDTQVIIGNNTYDFRLEFTGNMPGINKLSNVAGVNVQGKQVAVITVMDGGSGTRLFFLTDGSGTFTVMNAMPNGAIALTSYSETGAGVLICFADGTLIATPRGEVPVETLTKGDLVTLADGRIRPIRWIGRRTLSATDLIFNPNLRPIRVPAGTFGEGLPHSDLWLSRQHRVLVEGWEVELNFGCDAALVPVGQLVGDRIHVDHSRQEVTYFHILFDDHEIVLSNGLPSESYQPGTYSIAGMEDEARAEILMLFPDLDQSFRPDACPSVTGRIARVLAHRDQDLRRA